MYITSDVMILNANCGVGYLGRQFVTVLLSEEVGVRSSKTFQKKLSSVNWLYFLYAVLIMHHIIGLEVQDECNSKGFSDAGVCSQC